MQFTYGIGQNHKQAQDSHIPDKQAKATMLLNPLTTVWRFSFHIERRIRIFLFGPS